MQQHGHARDTGRRGEGGSGAKGPGIDNALGRQSRARPATEVETEADAEAGAEEFAEADACASGAAEDTCAAAKEREPQYTQPQTPTQGPPDLISEDKHDSKRQEAGSEGFGSVRSIRPPGGGHAVLS